MKLRLSELHYNLGHVLHQRGDLAASIAAYRRALQLNSSFAPAHHSLAVALAEQGQIDAAIWHYYQVIALGSDQGSAKAYNNLGCLLIEQQRFAEASQLYRRALERYPDQAMLHSNFGKAIESQDPVAAYAAYRRAIQLQPQFVNAHYNLGQVLLRQGQHQAAIAAFQQVLQLDPDHTGAQTGCGYAYQALQRFDRALVYFRQALERRRDWIAAFCDWSEMMAGEDQLSRVRRSCSQFLRGLMQSAPADWSEADRQTLHQQLAETHAHFGDLLRCYGGVKQAQQAEFHYQQALQLQPDRWQHYGHLAACLAQQQRWNAAIAIYHLAIALAPTQAVLYQQLGELLERQQRWSEAIDYYRRAMQQLGQLGSFSLLATADSPDRSSHLTPAIDAAFPSPTQDAASLETKLETKLETDDASWDLRGVYLRTCDWIGARQTGHWTALQVDRQQLRPVPATPQPGQPQSLDPNPDCDGLNCAPCLQNLTQQFWPVQLGRQVYRLSASASAESPAVPPDYFVAQLPQAQAWMTPYQSDWMVTNAVAVLSPDRYLLADVSREYPGQLPNCSRSHTSYARLRDRDPVTPEPIAGSVAVLAGLSGHNYFHWMVDVLPRFELLRCSGLALSDIDWFWINGVRSPFQQATLDRLGIPAAKVLSADRHPAITAESLIVPSFPGHLGWAEPWVLAFLRQQFLPIAASQPGYERIYISRANANHRRLLNEAAVIDRLQALGFQVIELETRSLAEQIALFAQAKVIVAPHGGGLTNLIFAAPGTIVIELMTRGYLRHYYWQISRQLQLQHFFAIGESFTCPPIQALMYPSPLMEDLWLNLETLEIALAQAQLL